MTTSACPCTRDAGAEFTEPSPAPSAARWFACEDFTAPGPDVDRLNYAFSVLHCLPATRAEGAKVEAGTVLRPATVRAYAREAGYDSAQVLPVAHDLWRCYRLYPPHRPPANLKCCSERPCRWVRLRVSGP